jgi:FkbM family methyltransferase
VSQQPRPFGHHQPKPEVQRKINWSRKLPNNWLGKQLAQWLRKQVINNSPLPLDLTLDEVRMRCYLTDNVSERGFVFMPWRWDATERKVMMAVLPKEGVMIDIGANVGIYAAQAATSLNRLGTVLAIEANPQLIDRLTFNLMATREPRKEKPRIEIINTGISDRSGEFTLYLDEDNLGASSLLAKGPEAQQVQVSCEPLLAVIDQQKLSRTDVIKCDIEGAEDRALIPFLLDAPHHLLPRCLIFENNRQHWQEDLTEVLKQRNYLQTHQTRMNFIYQLRQPIRYTAKQSKVKQAVPVIS